MEEGRGPGREGEEERGNQGEVRAGERGEEEGGSQGEGGHDQGGEDRDQDIPWFCSVEVHHLQVQDQVR